MQSTASCEDNISCTHLSCSYSCRSCYEHFTDSITPYIATINCTRMDGLHVLAPSEILQSFLGAKELQSIRSDSPETALENKQTQLFTVNENLLAAVLGINKFSS